MQVAVQIDVVFVTRVFLDRFFRFLNDEKEVLHRAIPAEVESGGKT
ncbi:MULTISPECIES: hypothetical protein [Pectobacterium]|nr:hypothetical protein [Pectobacterium zantedeschiae]